VASEKKDESDAGAAKSKKTECGHEEPASHHPSESQRPGESRFPGFEMNWTGRKLLGHRTCPAKLLIDCEEDRTLRAVLIGMLREADR
jgi:hypothetical protein